jgi:hypothetical protein
MLAAFAGADAWLYSRKKNGRKPTGFAPHVLFTLYIWFFAVSIWYFLLRQWLPLFGWQWPAVAAGYGVALWLSARRGYVRMATGLIWGGVAMGWLMAAVSHAPRPLAAAAAGTAAIAAAGLFHSGSARGTACRHLALTAATMLLLARLCAFYFFIDIQGAERMSRNPSVQTLYSYTHNDPVRKIIGNAQVYSITPGCSDDVFFLTTRRGNSGLVEFHKQEGVVIRHGAPNISDNAVSNTIAVDCVRKRLYSGMYGQEAIHVFDLTGMRARPRAIIPLGIGHPLDMAYSPVLQRLFVTDESHTLHVIDTHAERRVSSTHEAGKYVARSGPYLGFVGTSRLRVLKLDAAGNKTVTVASVRHDDGTDQGAVSAHPALPLLYVNEFLAGQLCVRRLPDLSLVRCATLHPGLRFTAVSPNGKRVASVDHIRGVVYFLDTGSMQITGEFRVGARARDITFSGDGRFAYVPSSAGGFQIAVP